jgi:hypothetical protein
MAIVKGAFKMSGSIQNVTFYTNPGNDNVIARTKGGPSARRMKVGEEFAVVRKHQTEWAACVMFSNGIHKALGETYHLADYNVSPVWNGMGKNLIKSDSEHPVGERNLYLSLYRQALENFSLNRNYPFNTVLRISLEYEVNKEILQATVKLPRINTEMNLLNIQKLPYFHVIVSLGIVSDIIYNPDSRYRHYEPTLPSYNGCSASTLSDWFSTDDLIDPQTLTVKLDDRIVQQMTPDTTALLGIGVEFGKVGFGGQITPVKHAGCGKILASV